MIWSGSTLRCRRLRHCSLLSGCIVDAVRIYSRLRRAEALFGNTRHSHNYRCRRQRIGPCGLLRKPSARYVGCSSMAAWTRRKVRRSNFGCTTASHAWAGGTTLAWRRRIASLSHRISLRTWRMGWPRLGDVRTVLESSNARGVAGIAGDRGRPENQWKLE